MNSKPHDGRGIAWTVIAACFGCAVCAGLPALAATPDTGTPAGLKQAKASNCFACHAIDHKVVGPAFDAIAKRYAGANAATLDKLAEKVVKGGSGNWGQIAMTPHPELAGSKARTIVAWVLSLHPGSTGTGSPTAENAKTYTYKGTDGKTVTLDYPLYLDGQPPKVTKEVFNGYLQFNSTCNRCHGDDAVGGAYAAPDLRHSLSGGMTYEKFLATAMAGREAKGMPSWAGFFTPAEIRDIYEYVKGRSVGLIPEGRPPSAQD
ncbi:MAG: cytochrome C [Nevskiaceae bacterium]|nr:MAG: cytochrome C [Nevskiaceae bacterium]TBR73368.1 MAG: cytochrome C [Nevskiaceae bacterium]